MIDGCKFETIKDIQEEKVQTFLDKTREDEDLGHWTYNHYVQAFDGFCRWLVTSKRLSANPVSGLVRLNTEVDVRHKRRALTAEEFVKLVESARAAGPIQGFSGEQRARIYIISYLTGLRRTEIASLTPRSFALTADTPTVTVQAACSKHRRTDVLPLHPQLVVLLREWIKSVAPDEILFPKLAKRRTWLMVKKDLKRVGIEYETPDGIADFHAAGRHTYISGLLQNGASLPETKELARHSDVNMTMRYTHVGMQDRAKAVARLPHQERFRSASDGAQGLPKAPGDAPEATKEVSPETTKPRW